ncbi:MAG: DUF4956 domain-containing protein [Eubacteriales bacterium]
MPLRELIFSSVLDNADSVYIDPVQFGFCLFVALISGLIVAGFYTYKTKYTKSFFMTLTTLPAAVAMVILMVNGSVGTGVAVAGAFSLIRFRSVPGTAKEISAIFLAMGAGLAAGLGYLAFGLIFALLLSLVNVGLSASSFGERKKTHRTLLITMPEHLDYTTIYDDIFDKFTNFVTLVGVKTTSMGSLFKLTYDLELRDGMSEKDFIDELRCRNGNLEISLTKQNTIPTEL